MSRYMKAGELLGPLEVAQLTMCCASTSPSGRWSRGAGIAPGASLRGEYRRNSWMLPGYNFLLTLFLFKAILLPVV